jgi:predicted DNA-binding protein (MmcQ/YjbR family)
MNAKRIRAICLALPDTSEGTHHDALAFKVGKKLFATYRENKDELAIGLHPDHADALVATKRATRYSRATNAVIITVGKIKVGELKELIRESYDLVAPKK